MLGPELSLQLETWSLLWPCLVPINRVTYKSRHFKSVMFGCSDL
jgi:hypothetical protein